MTDSSPSKMLPRINNYSMLKEALLEETKMLTRTFTFNDKIITFGELVKYFGELVNSNADTAHSIKKNMYPDTRVVDSFKDTDVIIRYEESMDSFVTVFDNIIITNYLLWFDKLLELVASHDIRSTVTLKDITEATGGGNEYKSVQRGGVINQETAIMIMVIIKKTALTYRIFRTTCDMHYSAIIITGTFNNFTDFTKMFQSRWKTKRITEDGKSDDRLVMLNNIKGKVSTIRWALRKLESLAKWTLIILRVTDSAHDRCITALKEFTKHLDDQKKQFNDTREELETQVIAKAKKHENSDEVKNKIKIEIQEILRVLKTISRTDYPNADRFIKICAYLLDIKNHTDYLIDKIVDTIYNIKTYVNNNIAKNTIDFLLGRYSDAVFKMMPSDMVVKSNGTDAVKSNGTEEEYNDAEMILKLYTHLPIFIQSNIKTGLSIATYLSVIMYILEVSDAFITISCDIYHATITKDERSINHILQFCIDTNKEDAKYGDVKESVITLQNLFPGNLFNMMMAIYQLVLVLINIHDDFGITYNDYLETIKYIPGMEYIASICKSFIDWYDQPSSQYMIKIREKIAKEIGNIEVVQNDTCRTRLNNALKIPHNTPVDFLLYAMTTGLFGTSFCMGNTWDCMMAVAVQSAGSLSKVATNKAICKVVDKLNIEYGSRVVLAVVDVMLGEAKEQTVECVATYCKIPKADAVQCISAVTDVYVASDPSYFWTILDTMSGLLTSASGYLGYTSSISSLPEPNQLAIKYDVARFNELRSVATKSYVSRVKAIMEECDNKTNEPRKKLSLMHELLTIFSLNYPNVTELINSNSDAYVKILNIYKINSTTIVGKCSTDIELNDIALKLLAYINSVKSEQRVLKGGYRRSYYQINKKNYLKLQKISA